MNGIILIDKPKEWTSFDVVNKVRRMVQHSEFNTSNKKRFPTGHTGTLDPLATGLLVVLLGTYTKRAMELTKLDKTYEVTMKLGEVSSTADAEGEKTFVSDREPTKEEVTTALQKFVGEIEQIPPAFSAVKVNGQRAYKLARAGKEVVIEPRKVRINSIVFTDYAYPFITFVADVSSGTYIRSLVEDLGKELATGAYMSDLRRTRVGQYSLEHAVGMEGLSPELIAERVIEPENSSHDS
ncbi:MAG: tRNA pseudouridine synthase [Candidatus Saccharibacteria bacterium]|nr:tRNA pseudouridine synthase [Candidatus Saccharibacteria bacterium]